MFCTLHLCELCTSFFQRLVKGISQNSEVVTIKRTQPHLLCRAPNGIAKVTWGAASDLCATETSRCRNSPRSTTYRSGAEKQRSWSGRTSSEPFGQNRYEQRGKRFASPFDCCYDEQSGNLSSSVGSETRWYQRGFIEVENHAPQTGGESWTCEGCKAASGIWYEYHACALTVSQRPIFLLHLRSNAFCRCKRWAVRV